MALLYYIVGAIGMQVPIDAEIINLSQVLISF